MLYPAQPVHAPHHPHLFLAAGHRMLPHAQVHAPENAQRPQHEHGWSLKTIELVEVPAPPRRLPSASYYSSSYASSSDSSSSYESSDAAEQAPAVEEDDEALSSYCSSDEDEELAQRGLGPRAPNGGTRRRVLAWRESFSCGSNGTSCVRHRLCHPAHDVPFAVPSATASPVVRSASSPVISLQVCTTRTALQLPPLLTPSPALQPALAHRASSTRSDAGARTLLHTCCSACDACFQSLTTYRRHGSDDGAPEPCRAAVSYGLEGADAA